MNIQTITRTTGTIFFFSLIALLLFTGTDCKDKPPVVPPDNKPPDTTSHNFAFTAYTFGGNAGSSYFKDVAIINDSDIWAVGQIYTSPETTYNAAHWDGKKWELKKISTALFGGGEGIFTLNTVFAFGNKDVWMFSAAGSYAHWNGQEWTTQFVSERSGGGDKFWGTSSQNLYIVGTNGSIAHYNGSTWSKQESGTTIDLRDVWGTPDGKVVWACGYSNDNSKSILLKYENNQWKTIWQREGTTPISPYYYDVNSIWSTQEYLFVAGDAGIYKNKIGDTTVVQQPITPIRYSNAIRGNSTGNHIAVVYDDDIIWHYNNSSWKQIRTLSFDKILRAVAIHNNTMVVAGVDYSVGKALIYIAKQ